MNRQLIRKVMNDSINASISFPEVIKTLQAEGIELYQVDLMRGENRYYSWGGDTHIEPASMEHDHPAKKFSAEKVANAVRASQAGKITYQQFINEIIAAGTVSYVVHIAGKRVNYTGWEGDSHVEFFPGSRAP